MAFGFSPKYAQELAFENLTHEQFLVLAIEAAKALGWNIGYTSGTGFIAYPKFSMISWGEEVKVKIEDGYANLKSECTGNQLVDWGKNKSNIEDFVATFEELKSSISSDELGQKYNELKPNLVSKEDDLSSQPPPATKEKITNVLAIFKPTKGYFITPIIVDLNIAIFILMVISGVNFILPDAQSLIAWGANFKPLTLQGEWWRLITNVFLHFGILHLLFNMYALIYVGLLLEPYLGKTKFLAAYLLTGIAGSTASLWYHDLVVSAGASGAIFGMYGVFLAMLTTNVIEKSTRKALLVSIAVFVGYNLMNGMKGGIDNAAHIGGLVSGFVIGYVYYPSLRAPEAMDLKVGTVAALSVVIVSTCGLVYWKMPNDIAQYDSRIKTFASNESMALEVYSMPENTPREKLLSEIQDRGIYYWNENIELIKSLEKLKIPDRLHSRDRLLINYSNLRLRTYDLLYKAVNENTEKYKDSILNYNKKIEAVVDSLKSN